MDTSSEIYDNSYAEIMQHSLVQDTISRHTISVGTPTITADRFWIDSGSSFGTLNTEDYITGLNTRYYSQSDKPKSVAKPFDEIKLDLLDNIRTVKDRTDLYMLLSKTLRELQF